MGFPCVKFIEISFICSLKAFFFDVKFRICWTSKIFVRSFSSNIGQCSRKTSELTNVPEFFYHFVDQI